MENGFITISRDLLSSGIWADAHDTALFLYCLMRASHNHFGHLKPGQFYASVTSMVRVLGWSRNCIKAHLKQLKSAGLITVQETPEGTLYTIIGWETISALEHQGNPHRVASGMCHDLTAGGQEMMKAGHEMTADVSQNDHYQKEYQKETDTITPRARDFEIWWRRYPRHERKSAAMHAWMQMVDVPSEVLMQALENAKRSPAWLKECGKYIPSAAKWLDGNWEDFIDNHESEVQTVWTEY